MTALHRLADADVIARLLRRDLSLFSAPDDADARASVASRLGWLCLAEQAPAVLPDAMRLAESARAEGVSDVVLLGMGGSSLASLVISTAIGGTGDIRLRVLDTTAPVTVMRTLEEVDPARALYLVSSKSGGTIEPNSLYAIFAEQARERLGEHAAGDRFVALTDPGTPLEATAREAGFRHVFSTPPDVGGRFSALTAFGLVPAALVGVDLPRMLERALAAEAACSAPPADNPAAALGAFMIDAAESGADKLTIVAPEHLRTFGYWVEQLVAESLGKQGKGIVPVVELGDEPQAYGSDRAVVVMHGPGDERFAERWSSRLRERALFDIELGDEYDIAREFVRWEYAVALAAPLLGVNPFDEPSVAEAKAATAAILSGAEQPPEPQLGINGVAVAFAGGLEPTGHTERSVTTAIGHALGTLKPGDYVAILAYLPDDDALLEPLRRAIPALAAASGHAVCLELGPRYLHSTGQLHKGGPDLGVFILVSTQDPADVAVPGESWSLCTLHRSQAQGDLVTLARHGRRVLWLDLPDASGASVTALAASLEDAVYPTANRYAT